MAHKQTAWQKHLMAVYHDLKSKDKSVSLTQAMKVAKRSYKK